MSSLCGDFGSSKSNYFFPERIELGYNVKLIIYILLVTVVYFVVNVISRMSSETVKSFEDLVKDYPLFLALSIFVYYAGKYDRFFTSATFSGIFLALFFIVIFDRLKIDDGLSEVLRISTLSLIVLVVLANTVIHFSLGTIEVYAMILSFILALVVLVDKISGSRIGSRYMMVGFMGSWLFPGNSLFLELITGMSYGLFLSEWATMNLSIS